MNNEGENVFSLNFSSSLWIFLSICISLSMYKFLSLMRLVHVYVCIVCCTKATASPEHWKIMPANDSRTSWTLATELSMNALIAYVLSTYALQTAHSRVDKLFGAHTIRVNVCICVCTMHMMYLRKCVCVNARTHC